MRDLTVDELKKEHGVSPVSDIFWYSKQLAEFGSDMLNHDAVVAGSHGDSISGLSGNVFCRCNSPWKTLSGGMRPINKARRIAKNTDEDIWLASYKKIRVEVRVYVDHGLCCARYCRPKSHFGRDYGTGSSLPFELLSFVKKAQVCTSRFVLDLAVYQGDWKILELNPIDACGIYGNNIKWFDVE